MNDDFVQYPKQIFFAFPQARLCSHHVLKFGAFFQPSDLIKKVLIKIKNVL